MEDRVVTIQLSETLYDELRSLADEEGAEPIDVIGRLVARAASDRAWLRDLQHLQERILKEGGLQIGSSRGSLRLPFGHPLTRSARLAAAPAGAGPVPRLAKSGTLLPR
jgi:hypothetical protein